MLRKGQMLEATIVLTTVLFVVLFLVGSSFFLRQTVIVTLAHEQEKIQVVDFAHLAEKCFSEGDLVLEFLLTEVQYESCQLPKGEITLKLLDGSMEWTFGSGGKQRHRIFVSILRENGEIQIGELNVKL